MGQPMRGLPCTACGSPECQGDCPEPMYYCLHGEEVGTPGGACYWCAQEDAYESPWEEDE